MSVGARLSHYRIVEQLGEGGMGVVYRAHDERLDRDVALKILPDALNADPTARARQLREARLASALNHPNICTIYEVGEAEDRTYIAMELVEGCSLRAAVPPGGMSAETASRYGRQIADALDHAHRRGIVHRDLSGGNVVITPEGRVKILDFGLAKRAGPGEAALRTPATGSLTEPGTVMGTPHYLAPEVLRGRGADARGDLWSLGVLLYLMLAGRLPFHGGTEIELLAAILNDEPPPLPGSVPAGLRAVVERCMAKDPDRRYAQASDAHEALEATTSDRGDALPAPGAALAGRPLAIAVVLALVVLGSVLVWIYGQRGGFPSQPTLKPLTSNPVESPVLAASLSRDGSLLAFADTRGLHVRRLASGETRRLPLPGGVAFAGPAAAPRLAWHPDGSHLLAGGLAREGGEPGLWRIATGAGEARMLREGAAWPAISPDGERIAFVTDSAGRSALWMMNAAGEQARLVRAVPDGARVSSPAWSPDGTRLAYLRAERGGSEERFAIETCPVRGGSGAVVLSDPRLRGGDGDPLPLVWRRDGTIVFSRAELPPDDHESNLWRIRVDRRGRRAGEPSRLTRWSDLSLTDLSESADGSKLACVRGTSQADVYVARLEAGGARLSGTRRLTRDRRHDRPADWTRDSRSVLFVSDRAGQVFLQPLDRPAPQALGVGSARVWDPRFSPDGRWLMYWTSPGPGSQGTAPAMSLVRVPRSGGAAESVLKAAARPSCRCARSAAGPCVLAEVIGRQVVFAAFDPAGGRRDERLRLEVADAPRFGWDLSPEGGRIALVGARPGDDRIRLLDLRGGPAREVRAAGWDELESVAWSCTAEGWFVTSRSPRGVSLLHVDPTGRTRLLRTSRVWLGDPVPSPDGRYLTFAERTSEANVWLVEGL